MFLVSGKEDKEEWLRWQGMREDFSEKR